MPLKLKDSVVVLVGASSGIGRAAALQFARKGARLVVAARRADLLASLVDECQAAGGQAIAVPTDVTDEAAVLALAERATETFGRVDVWVNNAGAAAFGRCDEVPMDAHERVIATDLLGTFHGARAALAIFRRQGGGVLINTGSLDSVLSEPYMSSYVAAKHGVAGLGMALRQELAVNGDRGIHVCTVMPETIDTPFFQHAANYSGRAVRAMPPVISAERVAQAIVSLAQHPSREVFAGNAARQFWLQYVMAPGATERMMGTLANRLQLARDEAAPRSDGSLYAPMEDGPAISGGWKTATGRNKGQRASGSGLAAMLLTLLPLVPLGLLLWSTTRRRVSAD